MNKKLLITTAVAAVLGSTTLSAQTVPNWKVGGNALTASGKFGSASNFPVDFITNNVKRMTLTNTGNLRFNSDQSSIQFPNPGSSPKPIMFLYESGSSNKGRMIMAYSSGFPTFGFRTDGFNKFDFTDGINTALGIDLGPDNVGIGTLSPLSKLHVKLGNSGTIPFSQSVITAENSNNAYINLLAPAASETGILFGTSANNVSGGVVYNSTFQGSAPNALQFRTAGNLPRMVLTAEGRVGIGTTNPFAQLAISGENSNSEVGLLIIKGDRAAAVLSNKSLFGTIQATNTVGSAILAFSSNGDAIFGQTSNPNAFAGNFDGDVFTTGTYQSSDERLKQNISDFTNAMGMINKLHPKLYKFKKEGDYALMHLPQGDHYGLIAQEVEKILPNLVKQTKFDKRMKPGEDIQKSSAPDVTGFKALNYTEFIPIIIKAMQELSAQNDDLQKQLNEIKATSSTAQNSKAILFTSASLEQNTPNPFSNSTTIHYTFPQKFTSAQIVITDNSGNTLRRMNVSGEGKGTLNVDAATLSSGSYNYSLIVDGKIIETKRMILIK